jgi:uncharacterized protein (TIGR03086 family)
MALARREAPMDALDALDVAVAGFGDRLSQVEGGQWSGPTPCEEWDVRFLVAHVVGGNRFAALVLGGMSAQAAIERVMADTQLGEEPLADHEASATAQREMFRAPGARQRAVSHPLGDMTGDRFLGLRVFDVTMHTWDLARAIGADEVLDPGLARVVLDVVESAPAGMGFGITAVGRVERGAPVQDRLLDLTGRRAG